MIGNQVVQRKLADVKGVCLHQTAAWYSVSPQQLKKAGGDEQLARHTRFLAVNAPATAGRHGKVVLAHSITDYVEHGEQLNAEDYGLEHEGLYDADGNPIKKPNGVDVGEIIEAGRACMEMLVEQCPSLQWVDAHRQARRPGKGRHAKTSDPGKRIFQEVGMWAVRKFGLKVRPDMVWGIGRPLPKSWVE